MTCNGATCDGRMVADPHCDAHGDYLVMSKDQAKVLLSWGRWVEQDVEGENHPAWQADDRALLERVEEWLTRA